jgi:Baseplate J-like protein
MAIYYLDVDDEITSAAARIRGSIDAHVALVMPTGSRVATSRINFKLLEREAKQRNKRLAIVAPDASVRSLAQSAGLPVFTNVREYEAAEAARPKGGGPGVTGDVSEALGELAATIGPSAAGSRSIRGGGSARGGAASPVNPVSVERAVATSRHRRRLGLTGVLLIGLLAIIAAAGAFAAYQLWPSATVVLTVHEKPLGPIALTVKIDPAVVAVNSSTLTVPGITKSFDVKQDGTFDATGQNVVETAATGTVTVSNNNNGSSVAVPAGTVVSTADGISFATTKNASVPRATTTFTKPIVLTPGTVDVSIQAVQKGTSGNVKAGAIVRLPASLKSALVQGTVTNAGATTGGTHKVTPVVQQSDLDKATASLTKSIDASFADALANPGTLPAGVQLFVATGRLGAITLTPDPKTLLNQQVGSFQLAAEATGTATEADTTNVRSLAESRITSRVQPGYILVDGSLTTTMGSPTTDGAVVSIPVTTNATEAATVSVDVLKANIKGKSVADARAYLLQFGDATVSLSPWWASSVPTYDFRIDLTLVAPSSHLGPDKSPGSTKTAASASGSAGASSSASASSSSSAAATASPSPTTSIEPSASAS